MRIETSMFAKQHLEYLKSDKAHTDEMRKFDTPYDHMYFYLTSVVGLTPSTAQSIVDDLKSDLMDQPDLD